MSILTNFGKSQISKFADFRIKIEPNVDSFGLILRKTFPSIIFQKKKNQVYIIFTYKRPYLFKNSEIFRKIPEIADGHNFGTEYARDVNPKRAGGRILCYISAGCYFFALKLHDFFSSSLALILKPFFKKSDRGL